MAEDGEGVTYRSHRCLLTYGASGKSITHEMCMETGRVTIDECYTLTQRDLKYTLVHILQRTVRSTMSNLMCHLDEKYQIKSACVFGYDAVLMGSEIDQHPGMLLIIENIKRASSALECWMATGEPHTNKQGMLYIHLKDNQPEAMTKTQLLKQLRELKRSVEEKDREIQMHSRENRQLKQRLEAQRFVFTRAGRANELLP